MAAEGADIELGSSSASLSAPLQSSDSARSVSLRSSSPAEPAEPTPAPAVFDEKALIAELQDEEYEEWITKVMQHGKARSNWVWRGADLGEVLAADDPKRWGKLKIAIKAKGWKAIPQLHPKSFVLTGIHNGEDYLCCRRYPTIESFQVNSQDWAAEWKWYMCFGCHYVKAFCGMFLNLMLCCFWYVLPNCCCAWRWPCCQAPGCCCGRSYESYDDIEPQVKTGDIFLFCGTNGTRFGGQSHWSHIGIALRDDAGDIGPKGLLYVFEANFGRPGWDHCDLRLLREKIETYKDGATDCAWRPLVVGGGSDAHREDITNAILHHCGAKYDHDMVHMMKAAMDCCPCFDVSSDATSGQTREMFCSQAVARILQEAKVLPGPPTGPPACEFLPRDFGLVAGCNDESRMVGDILGPMHMIKRTNYAKWTGMEFR